MMYVTKSMDGDTADETTGCRLAGRTLLSNFHLQLEVKIQTQENPMEMKRSFENVTHSVIRV